MVDCFTIAGAWLYSQQTRISGCINLCLRYGWLLKNVPSYCVCGSVFSTDHAMTCSHGGISITRHNDIRDITANWLSEVCRNVERKPPTAVTKG